MIERRSLHQFTDSPEWPRAIGPALVQPGNGDLLCSWVAGPSLELGDGQPGLSAVSRRSTDGPRAQLAAQDCFRHRRHS